MELESCSATSVRASKRLRLSSVSQKVCVVLRCMHPDGDEYKFYIVDLDSSSGGGGGGGDEFIHKEPIIRFKGSVPGVAFCALNSTLYMFEGDMFLGGRMGGRTFAGKFEISEEEIIDYNLKKENLVKIKAMRHGKISPIALPTPEPDGNRILVFSSEIIKGDGGLFYGDIFELYNVSNDTWEDLPPLVPSCGGSSLSSFLIQSYGFLTDSRFVILIESGIYGLKFGMYGLDLNAQSQSKVWEEFGGIPDSLDGYFIGIHDYEFYFAPHSAYANFNYGHISEFEIPVSEFPNDYDYVPSYVRHCDVLIPHTTLLGHSEDGVFDMVIVQAKFHPVDPYAQNLRVMLDIYRTDTEQFKRATEMRHSPFCEKLGHVTKTLKLMLDFDLSIYLWDKYNNHDITYASLVQS